jgi:iron complex outermembrane receptor protein
VIAQNDSIQNACHYSLSGAVVDGETKEPLEGAEIFIKQLQKGTITTPTGHFHFSALCAGTYEVHCSYWGYKPIVTEIILHQNTHKSFILHSDTCELESVIITIPKEEIKTANPVLELKGKELDRTKGLSLGEALKTLPGVNALQTGPSIFKPVIQGMYGNRVLIMNNGVRQEGQQWGSEHAPEIDPFIAGKITIVKGATGVRYGSDAIGGVVLIDPKELRSTPGLGGEFNLVGFSNNREGVASGIIDYAPKGIKGLTGRLQGTMKQAGNSKTPDYYLKNTAFEERNYSWALGYKREKAEVDLFYSRFNSKIGIFSASHIGNLTDLKKAIASDVPLENSGFSYAIDRPYQDVKHELFRIRSMIKIKDLGKAELILARQYNFRSEYDKHHPYNEALQNLPQAAFHITTHTGALTFSHYSYKGFSGDIGSIAIVQRNTFDGTSNPFIPNFKSFAMGFFVIERYKFKKMEWEGGIRYDFKNMGIYKYENDTIIHPTYSFGNFSGTAGIIYSYNEHYRFRSNIGTSFRPPAVNELFSDGLHHGAASIELGDRNLKSEISYNLNLSLQYKFTKLYGEITGYYNDVKNYIYLAPVVVYDSIQHTYSPDYQLTIRGAFPVFKYQQINASFAGLDATLNDSINKHFIVSAKGSLLRAYNKTYHEYLILTPPAMLQVGLRYNCYFMKSLSNTYVSVNGQYVFRKSKVPVYRDITPPPAGYFLLNMEAGGTVRMGTLPVDITFTINNTLNSRYRNYLDRFRYFADAVGRNFIVRIKIPFNIQK